MLDDCPVNLAVFINCGFAGQGSFINFADARIVMEEFRRSTVSGCNRNLFHGRIVDGVGQEEICVIFSQFCKCVLRSFNRVAHTDTVFLAANHLAAARVDSATQRTILKLIAGRSRHTLFVDRPVERAILGGGNIEIDICVFNRRGFRISGCEVGFAVVWRREVNRFYYALIIAAVYQHGR